MTVVEPMEKFGPWMQVTSKRNRRNGNGRDGRKNITVGTAGPNTTKGRYEVLCLKEDRARRNPYSTWRKPPDRKENKNPNMVDVDRQSRKTLFLTVVYASLDGCRRNGLWPQLLALKSTANYPWDLGVTSMLSYIRASGWVGLSGAWVLVSGQFIYDVELHDLGF
ncbi:hypothetical protein V6N13_133824 [Hibiscus sabdariffa]